MMDSKALSDLLDGFSKADISKEAKSSCKKASAYFGELIRKNDDNIFSFMASDEKRSLSQALKITVPGEDVCDDIEKIRKCIFEGESTEKIVTLYFGTIMKSLKYIDYVKIEEKITIEEAFEAVLAFYEMYGIRCFKIDEKLYSDVKNGVSSSFKPFFQEYLAKYRTEMKEIMEIPSFGAERNYESNYRKATYKYIELLLSYVYLFAFRYELVKKSFEKFSNKLTKEIVSDSEAFYQHWYSINNQTFEESFAGDEFGEILLNFSNVYNGLIIEVKKLYESHLDNVPVAKESDMRELYKTIYELRKELDEVKKELAEVKKC